MKKFGLAVIGLAFLFALSTGVDAQVKTGGKNDSARAITISGSLDFDFVHRSEGINEILDNQYRREVHTGINTSSGPVEDDNFMQLYFNLRFDVELAEKVSAVLELENRVLQNSLTTGASQPGVGTNDSTSGGSGSNANVGLIGGQQGDEFDVHLGQAYIEVKEFLWQQLSFKLGIQDHKYDLRGNGNAFFMDLRESELAFQRPVTEAFAGNIYFGHEVPAAVANSGVGNAAINGGTTANLDNGLFRDQNREAGGLKFTYNLDDNLFVDLFWFQVMETSAGQAFQFVGVGPGTLAEQEDRFDEYVIGLNVDYNIDEKSLLNFIYAGIYGDDGAVDIHTLGFGIDYYITPALEAYLEFYGQFGTYGHVNTRGLATATRTDSEEIDQEAYAGIVGLKYTFDASMKPWIDLSFTYISGDDGDIATDGVNNHPDANHDFVSYEDNDATMILEENHFGLDVDSNYWKIQGDMGATFSLDRQDDFHIMTGLAWAELAHVPSRAGVGPGLASLNLGGSQINGGGDGNDELGLEWDTKLTWNYTESLDFSIGFAWLFRDNAGNNHDQTDDFWSGRRNRVSGQTDGFGLKDGEEMWLLTIDTKVKF